MCRPRARPSFGRSAARCCGSNIATGFHPRCASHAWPRIAPTRQPSCWSFSSVCSRKRRMTVVRLSRQNQEPASGGSRVELAVMIVGTASESHEPDWYGLQQCPCADVDNTCTRQRLAKITSHGCRPTRMALANRVRVRGCHGICERCSLRRSRSSRSHARRLQSDLIPCTLLIFDLLHAHCIRCYAHLLLLPSQPRQPC